MEVVESKGVVVVRLHDGEDFVPTLVQALERVNLHHGVVVTGVGMLRDFELGYFDRPAKTYRKRTFEVPHELLSLNGTVALAEPDAKVMPHLHASLAGPDHAVVGGHLFKATACVLNEVSILRMGKAMQRRLNPDTGLMELTLAGD